MITETPTIRLHVEAETSEDVVSESIGNIEIPGVQTLLELFPQITGWEVDRIRGGQAIHDDRDTFSSSFLQTPGGATDSDFLESVSSDKFGIVDMWSDWPDGRHCASRSQCDSLVQVFNTLIGQVETAYRQIELLNAQFAPNVPLTNGSDSGAILLQRLESVIRDGLRLLNVTAGGLYLLDDETRELNLRAQVGLPPQSLLKPPRKLRESIADLDALVGHPFAISKSGPVIHDQTNEDSHSGNPSIGSPHPANSNSGLRLNFAPDSIKPTTKPTIAVPEDFPAALCVPVASHSTPLGTLWFFSATDRVFSNHEISIAELIGGRIGSELERESAIREGASSRKMTRDFDRAKLWQQLQTPPQIPAFDGWSVKGDQFLEQGVGGTVLDYSISSAGELVAALGDIQGAVMESSLAASAMRGAVRTLETSNLDAERLLFEVNNTLWNCPLGDQIGSLFSIRLDPSSGIAQWSNAGETGALIVGRGCETEIATSASPLGACADETFESRSRVILPESTLFAFNSGFRRLFRYSFRKSTDEEILEKLQSENLLTPVEIQTWIEELVADFDSYRSTPDVCFLAIHRTADETIES